MSDILVSVVIPVFNCDQYIAQCVNSVCSQTLKQIEIIVLDDCSTDSTLANIPKDPRISIIRNTKQTGSGSLRNKGISLSRGKFVAFLDGDDYYPNLDSLRRLTEIAERENLNVVGGSLYILNSKTGEKNYFFPGQFFKKSGYVNYRDYQHDGGFYRFIYRRDFLLSEKIEFPNLLRMQDPVFFVQAMINAKTFYVIPDYVYAYRKSHKIVSWNYQQIHDKLKAIKLILKISREQKLNHLHFLMVKNYINFSNHHFYELRNLKNQFKIFKNIYNTIDFDLLKNCSSEERIRFVRLKLFGIFLKSLLLI